MSLWGMLLASGQNPSYLFKQFSRAISGNEEPESPTPAAAAMATTQFVLNNNMDLIWRGDVLFLCHSSTWLCTMVEEYAGCVIGYSAVFSPTF